MIMFVKNYYSLKKVKKEKKNMNRERQHKTLWYKYSWR